MGQGRKQVELSSMISDCVDALTRADADRIEWLRNRLRNIEDAGSNELGPVCLRGDIGDLMVLDRALQWTRANLDLIARFLRVNSVALEYSPSSATRVGASKD
jgi:hypothetical protein